MQVLVGLPFMKKVTKKDWRDCSIQLAEKLTRFQLLGCLASHDKSLARFNQLLVKDKIKTTPVVIEKLDTDL